MIRGGCVVIRGGCVMIRGQAMYTVEMRGEYAVIRGVCKQLYRCLTII